MALRVLLADESVTIKKVIQLALQDFAVEVKAVPVGLDVLEVSKSFHPDLVFADILLQKRSGYDVCADLKKDPETAAIPVVLMWSSFMELDQRQVDSCGADGRLEKPFEVEALRKLVLELVPRTRSQRLAHFLEYPSNIAAPLKQEFAKPVAPPPAKAPSPKAVSPTEAPPVKPKMPPPLVTKSHVKNPFASSLGAPMQESPMIHKMPAASERDDGVAVPDPSGDLTPVIPDRPSGGVLGALPDLQLEGMPAKPESRPDSQWSMDSFEPMEFPPLSLEDDDDDAKESFQPLQLPQAEPSLRQSKKDISESSGSDDADADADQWANKSLDKYRLPPLKPDESLAVDDRTPDFAAAHSVGIPSVDLENELADLSSYETDLIPDPSYRKPSKSHSAEDDVPNFSFDENDFDKTAPLEIEPVDTFEKTRPDIIRELLKDPDFSKVGVAAASAGSFEVSREQIEEMVRSQVEPHLEKMIQKIVGELLPPIAERIIKRELERLLEES